MINEDCNNNICRDHSGIQTRVTILETETKRQWNILDSLRNRSIAILTGIVMILFGVVINLIISWPK